MGLLAILWYGVVNMFWALVTLGGYIVLPIANGYRSLRRGIRIAFLVMAVLFLLMVASMLWHSLGGYAHAKWFAAVFGLLLAIQATLMAEIYSVAKMAIRATSPRWLGWIQPAYGATVTAMILSWIPLLWITLPMAFSAYGLPIILVLVLQLLIEFNWGRVSGRNPLLIAGIVVWATRIQTTLWVLVMLFPSLTWSPEFQEVNVAAGDRGKTTLNEIEKQLASDDPVDLQTINRNFRKEMIKQDVAKYRAEIDSAYARLQSLALSDARGRNEVMAQLKKINANIERLQVQVKCLNGDGWLMPWWGYVILFVLLSLLLIAAFNSLGRARRAAYVLVPGRLWARWAVVAFCVLLFALASVSFASSVSQARKCAECEGEQTTTVVTPTAPSVSSGGSAPVKTPVVTGGTHRFSILATNQCNQTLEVPAGQRVRIRWESGQWRNSQTSGWNDGRGRWPYDEKDQLVVPSGELAQLVGSIGGHSFVVGNLYEGTLPSSGMLCLFMNDRKPLGKGDFYGDNEGSLIVVVEFLGLK